MVDQANLKSGHAQWFEIQNSLLTSSDCSVLDLQTGESRLVFLLREKRYRKLPAWESLGEPPFKDKKLDDKLIVSRSDVLQLGAANNEMELWGFKKLDFLFLMLTGVENEPTKRSGLWC